MRFSLLRAGALCVFAALCACASSDVGRPGDLLTDTVDDGSLLAGALGGVPEVRAVAVETLANLPPVASVELLVERAHIERDERVLAGLAYLFGRWKQASATSVLESLSVHNRASVRAAALDGMARLGDDSLTQRLVLGLSDTDSSVRGAACLALARLDSARDTRLRTTPESELVQRDTALGEAALADSSAEVRWRAVWALGWVRPRPGFATIFREATRDQDPLVRLFALRGLAKSPAADIASLRAGLEDTDSRVAQEAAAGLALAAPSVELERRLASASSAIRALSLEGLRRAETDLAAQQETLVRQLAENDPSPTVVRAAWAALAAKGSPNSKPAARASLRSDSDPRSRVVLAELLASGETVAPDLLQLLRHDEDGSVRAAAARSFAKGDPALHREELLAALQDEDVAVRAAVAESCAPVVKSGRAPPWLVSALADALTKIQDPAEEEGRVALGDALGLPEVDPIAPLVEPEGRLLQRRLEELSVAGRDPLVRVLLTTNRGKIELELDRMLAPRHVQSFLDLVDDRFYDGLDFHRVVPNFVVQGLDPRGDGWGTGGRRLPDEFTPTPYLAGTVGMPRTGARHTGGCQLFITHIPTPHLDGEYTVMGRVVSGMDVVAELEVGDVVKKVRRL